MRKNWPTVSIILPTYNEEKNLPNCLKSIKGQDYPQKKIEILVVDDSSTDQTVGIARLFGAKIVLHNSHNCEMGRSIGLKKVKNDLVLIIDADNVLPGKNWLRKMIGPFLDNSNLVGSQSGWYQYEKSGGSLNRYCALFGASKPISFYLKKRNFLMAGEKIWPYPESLQKNTKDYFLVKFNPENMPTLGSQGFLGKRKLLLKTTYKPFYYHMDSLYELVKKKKNIFAIVKVGIAHRHTDSFIGFHQKFYRDISRFFEQQSQRKYLYQSSFRQQLVAALKIASLAIPFYDSLKGFLKIRDLAWFWHPVLCQTTLWLTLFAFLESLVKEFFNEKIAS